MNIQRAADMGGADVHVKGLLWGDSGAGKTYAAVTAPAPLVLLTEQNGVPSVRASNPDALIALCANIDEVHEVMRMAQAGRLPEGRRTLVVDSLTEVQRLYRDRIARGSSRFTLEQWGQLAGDMRGFMRGLRTIPYHVIATALASWEVDDAGERHGYPAFDGKKTAAEIPQFFSFVGLVRRRETEAGVERLITLEGPSRIVVKPCAPLTGTVPADVGVILDAITTHGAADAA